VNPSSCRSQLNARVWSYPLAPPCNWRITGPVPADRNSTSPFLVVAISLPSSTWARSLLLQEINAPRPATARQTTNPTTRRPIAVTPSFTRTNFANPRARPSHSASSNRPAHLTVCLTDSVRKAPAVPLVWRSGACPDGFFKANQPSMAMAAKNHFFSTLPRNSNNAFVAGSSGKPRFTLILL
jgi:hypothetical protein